MSSLFYFFKESLTGFSRNLGTALGSLVTIFLSLLITIAQTYAFRFIIKEDKVRAKMAENAKKPRKKSGFMARLEEAQKRQEALLREQQKQRKGGRR